MLKEIKIYIGSGCRFSLYSNKQISYQGQPKVIAKSNNSSSYIKQILCNPGIYLSWNLDYPPQKIFYSFVASIHPCS